MASRAVGDAAGRRPLPATVAVPARVARNPDPASPARRWSAPGPSRRRSEVADRAVANNHYCLGRPGSIGSSCRRSRACAPPGPNCCATGSTCCTKSASTRSIRSRPPRSVAVFTSHAPLPVHRRPEHPGRRVSFEGSPPGAERGRRPRRGRPRCAERPRRRLVGPGLAAELRVPRRPAEVRVRRAGGRGDLRARPARRASGAAVRFTCLVPPDTVNERIALVVKQQLEAVGVEMSVEEAPMDRIFEALKNRRFEAALIDGDQRADAAAAVSACGIRTAPFNAGGLGNPTVDAAFDRVRHAATDDGIRAGGRRASAGVHRRPAGDFPRLVGARPRRQQALRRARRRAGT